MFCSAYWLPWKFPQQCHLGLWPSRPQTMERKGNMLLQHIRHHLHSSTLSNDRRPESSILVSDKTTADPCSLWGHVLGKIPQTAKLWCMKARTCLENGVRGTKDIWNMVIHKLIMNKHEHICVGVCYTDVCELSGLSNDVMCMVERDRKLGRERGDLQLLCLLLHIHIHLLVCCHESLWLQLPVIHTKHFPSLWGRNHENLHKRFYQSVKHWP